MECFFFWNHDLFSTFTIHVNMAVKLCSAQSRLCFISSEHKKPLVRQHGSLRYIDYDISMLYLTAIDSTIRSTEIIRSYSYSEVIAPHILVFGNVSFHGCLTQCF